MSKKLGGTPTGVHFEADSVRTNLSGFGSIYAQSLAIFIGEEEDLETRCSWNLRIWRTPSTYPQPGRLTDSQVSKSAEWFCQKSLHVIQCYSNLFTLFTRIQDLPYLHTNLHHFYTTFMLSIFTCIQSCAYWWLKSAPFWFCGRLQVFFSK